VFLKVALSALLMALLSLLFLRAATLLLLPVPLQ